MMTPAMGKRAIIAALYTTLHEIFEVDCFFRGPWRKIGLEGEIRLYSTTQNKCRFVARL